MLFACLFISFSFKEYVITKLEDSQVTLKLQGEYQLLVSADGNNLFGDHIISVKKTQNICQSLVRGLSRSKALENPSKFSCRFHTT
jgi:hypothetical protein